MKSVKQNIQLMYLKIELLILKINGICYSVQIHITDLQIKLCEKDKDYQKYLQEQESAKKKKLRELFK
jgi:hypothetical protein